jgi:hypothetical protein
MTTQKSQQENSELYPAQKKNDDKNQMGKDQSGKDQFGKPMPDKDREREEGMDDERGERDSKTNPNHGDLKDPKPNPIHGKDLKTEDTTKDKKK